MPALVLDPIEARILGVLIEKELTTPDQYPLTLNALAAGANQKSNRDPVLELSDSEVSAGIERLRRKSLVGSAHSAGARVERYRQTATTVWELAQPEIAVLAELLLRGAQMPGELRSRAERMHRFETLEPLSATLESLRARGFVRKLDPQPGARAPSWEQILVESAAAAPDPVLSSAVTGMPRPAPQPSAPTAQESPPQQPSVAAAGGVERRIAALEAEVARLGRLYEELARRPTA